MVDPEVEAVADAVDGAFAGGVDGVVEGAAEITAVVAGEAPAGVCRGVGAPGLGFGALDGEGGAMWNRILASSIGGGKIFDSL